MKRQRILIHASDGSVVFDGNDEEFKYRFCGIGPLMGHPEPNYKVVDILCKAHGWTQEYPPEYVELKLDEDDARLIRYCLAQQYKKARQELQILLETRTRELTEIEYQMLPATLFEYTREELQEQIDPWITLVSHYEDVINEINKGIAEFDNGAIQ